MFHVKRFGTIDTKILASHQSSLPLGLVRSVRADVFLRLFWGRRGRAAVSEDFKEPVSGADEAKPPKKNAEDNPWYLLATLYGVGQHDKNRRAWNRYFAGSLDPKTRAKLIEEKRHPAEELTPFSWVELRMVERLFSKRKGSANFICHEIRTESTSQMFNLTKMSISTNVLYLNPIFGIRFSAKGTRSNWRPSCTLPDFRTRGFATVPSSTARPSYLKPALLRQPSLIAPSLMT